MLTVKLTVDTTTDVVNAGGALTANENVFTLVVPALSITVIEYDVNSDTAVGVPLIAPLVTLKLSPAGKLVSVLIENDNGADPPVAVTGINAGSTLFLTNVFDAIATVVTNGGSNTINLYDFSLN